jgi:hypothetical protein
MFKEDIARRFNNALKIDIDEFNSFIHFQFSLSDNIRSINTIKQKINHYQFGGQLDENQLHILKYYNCNTLFDFIDYCLNPTLNQIELLEYNDSFHPEVNCEVWTDADSLMIENNYLYDMLMNYY